MDMAFGYANEIDSDEKQGNNSQATQPQARSPSVPLIRSHPSLLFHVLRLPLNNIFLLGLLYRCKS